MELFVYILPFALLLGFFTSYSDIKSSKIKNYVLKYCLFFIILINVFFLAIMKFNHFNMANVLPYYRDYILSVVFVFLVSLILWIFGFWNAADSKLITVFALALPPSTVVYNYSSLYGVNFFYNVVFVNIIFFIFRSLRHLKTFDKKKLGYLPKFSFFSFFNLFLVVFSFGFVSRIFNFISNSVDRFYINILFMISLFYFLRKLKIQKYIIFIFFGISLYFNRNEFLNIIFWKNLFGIFLFLTFIRLFMDYLSISNVSIVKIDELKPGMHLAQDFVIDGKKKSRFLSDIISYDQFKGLSLDSISDIQKIKQDIRNGEILISRRDSFAPFIFIGYILTVLLQSNLLTFLRIIFKF
ncbi:hypothetical protein JXM83_00910 [Candidatus Woesearchaeota archaeon]|nr:hypothetical protein [Candidatus Woesearchaeota archaeon]